MNRDEAPSPRAGRPLDDQRASELISKSLLGMLTETEDVAVSEGLAALPETQKFARLCEMIQDSVAQHCHPRDDAEEIAQPLPEQLRARLSESVRLEAAAHSNSFAGAAMATPAAPAVGDEGHEGHEDWELAAKLLDAGLVSETKMKKLLTSWRPERSDLAEVLVASGSISPEVLDAARNASSNDSSVLTGDQWRRSGSLVQMKHRLQQGGGEREVAARFKLIRKLAEGGLGVVWIARDEKLKRIVALKEMHASAAHSEKAWRRFHREAEITGHLEHPNVVPLYLFGTDPVSGNPFYAMRFVGKRTLADAIAEYHDRRQSGDDAHLHLHRLLTAFLGACQAIAYAHSRGVIHRDLKPENIALDSFGQVIVLDWGLAKLSHAAELATQLTLQNLDGSDSAFTRTLDGEVIGTPLYMAPEQASGDAESVDERTDVYGLGAILFSILTGAAPHSQSLSESPNQTVAQALQSIADGASPSARQLNLQAPIDLDAICQRAMSRKPYARFGSASDLAVQVESWLAGQRSKQKSYDDMRMEAREIRANLLSTVWDLSTNVRFMANLPPIQGIIDAVRRPGECEDGVVVWRERLATIYQGLLGANRDYLSVSYSSVDEAEVAEVVRAERHSADHSNTRIVPKSRLLTYLHTPFSELVWSQNPEEVSLDMTEDCRCPNTITCSMRIVAGVPVFDQQTEDPYGFVSIECDLARVLDRQADRRRADSPELFVVAPNGTVVMHSGGAAKGPVVGELLSTVLPGHAERIFKTLASQAECLDETDREIYATKAEISRQDSITLLLCRNR